MSAPAVASRPGLHVVPASEVDAASWNAFVTRHPRSTICHAAGWQAVMADALGHEPLFRAALDEEGSIAGVLPLVRVRSRMLGHYLVSMPFLNYGGALGDTNSIRALEASALADARRQGADLLELRYPWTAQAAEIGSEELTTSARKITVLLSLPDTAAALWEHGFRAKLRSQIRRPEKEGMSVTLGPAQLDAFHEVFCRNMRDLGTPVLPRRFFEAMRAAFPDHIEFAVVRHQGRAVAAACGFFWGEEFEITWASALREYNRFSPNMLLYWSLMQHAIARGTRRFNFGRCTPGGSTHHFKSQWGGVDAALPWRSWSASGRDATPSPDSAKYRLAIALWQKLPLAVANRAGPVLARRLP